MKKPKKPNRKEYWAGDSIKNDEERYIYGIKQYADKAEKYIEYLETQANEPDTEALRLQNVSGCFSFAKYVNGWYEYADNTENGDVYNNVVTGRLMTEQHIFNEWLKLNNR